MGDYGIVYELSNKHQRDESAVLQPRGYHRALVGVSVVGLFPPHIAVLTSSAGLVCSGDSLRWASVRCQSCLMFEDDFVSGESNPAL